MGCNCGGSRAARTGQVTGYEVTTHLGEKKGPYLTQTEARIAVQEAGGGVIKPIRQAQ
ncbi:DUF7196 family protein [Nocardia abscessus]|uniref:DUF7196 family protein n=1 Tax=Nocardia abscessus TaxID=120957 RepID=UPI002456CA67|nr:hypothetical protein [Nocardia abscessus]